MQVRKMHGVVLTVLLVAAPLVAAEQTSKATNTLPAKIASAFSTAYPNATITGVSTEKYAGKDAYEVESVENGKTRDLIYLLDGSVAVMEEEIAASDLPAAVAAAIRSDYPKASVTRYERAVERGTTTYEVQLKGAKVGSAEYTADGKRK
ncbi:MAG: PepSY-like domain-containing protein [Vicinamibacterales bacterium]